ncbi:MAG: hypothetical protein CMM77_09840 [Rhodospirillaceae bacterium]|nr:hypothetical protein [Magnetovibrio sp.]MAY67416.1 hypothetical protein [Rhodospirillaceae bacterium]
MSKPAFPQTPSGVTDWEKVFEDPKDGLIAVIASAPNATALRSCLEAVTRQLFTRKGDELEITRVEGEIERMFANAGGGTPTDDAVALLRSIKDLRIRKAQEFLARKHADDADRRAKEAGSGLKRLAYLAFKDPKYLIGATVAMLALAGYLYIALNDVSTEPAESADIPPEPEAAAAAAVADAPPPQEGVVVIPPVGAPVDTVHKAEQSKSGPMSGIAAALPTQRRAAPPVEDTPPPTILFKHVPIPRPFVGKRGTANTVLPVAIMAERNVVEDICDIAPVIYHLVNIELSDAGLAGSDYSDFDLERMARTLTRKVNRELGRPLVARMVLIRDPGRNVFARHDCAQAPKAMVRRLNLDR